MLCTCKLFSVIPLFVVFVIVVVVVFNFGFQTIASEELHVPDIVRVPVKFEKDC